MFFFVCLNVKKANKQKHLVLFCLKELYIEFKKMYLDYKIGFSKFCELRPKWCITVNSSGTHCVCVYTYHHNAKLMLSFLPDNRYNYEDLMKLCVCAVEYSNLCFICIENVLTKQNYHQHL